MDQNEFNELHSSCVTAFKHYAIQADITSSMLANCTAEPLPLEERLRIALQERMEDTAHILYLGTKGHLHEAARLGYAFTGKENG
jgi:hypothetical protein